MSSTRTSSTESTSQGVELDDTVLLDLLQSLAALHDLDDSVVRVIVSFVRTRRYAPMPSPMSPGLAAPPAPKAPPSHLQ